MVKVRADNGARFQEGIAPLEQLVADYPGERLFAQILGQIYQGANRPDQARAAFEKAQAAHPTNRVRAFLANDDLLKGRYAEARAAFEAVERDLPRGAAPFTVRYGIAFSYLYEGQVDAALAALRTYLGEYQASGADGTFPEVFIWNSIARINLENGRPNEAMQAYEKGYESVPRSTLPDDQKKIWLGRLEHGKCRALARMGRHEEAWQRAQAVQRMIAEGGEEAKQFLPAYHYLAGYLKLESGDARAALEHLKQADPDDPFHELLRARAYERLGDKDNARKAYAAVVASGSNGLERALAYPEAKRKLAAL
jgi:predicted Zn-dependent protease